MNNKKGLEAFDQTQRLIVVAAHPDDLETLVSGTLIQLIARGVTVFSVNATLGNIGTHDPVFSRHTLAVRRLEETAIAAKLLGIEEVFALGHNDGELVADLTLRAQVARLYRLTQADTVLTFDPFSTSQIHPDHRAIGRAALDAFMPSKMPLYHPEQLAEQGAGVGCVKQIFLFSSNRDPDVLVDVSAVYEQKMAACVAHGSQFPVAAELEWMKNRDMRTALGTDMRYAEAFKLVAVH